jgi:hypothetical protein
LKTVEFLNISYHFLTWCGIQYGVGTAVNPSKKVQTRWILR